jgi:hypothetical protein
MVLMLLLRQIDTTSSNDRLASKIRYISEYRCSRNIYCCDKGGGIKKTVYKYNLDGSLNATFENLTLASETIGVKKQDISRACWNVNQTLGGYLWVTRTRKHSFQTLIIEERK